MSSTPIIHSNSFKNRVDQIINNDQSLQMVRQTPTQDLLVMLKEVGLVDCHELLELLSGEQVQALLDMDAWLLHRIDPKSIGDWLEHLYAANPRKALAQFMALDIELIALLYKLHAFILDTHAGEEPGDLDGLYSISPDGRFYVMFDKESPNQNLIYFLHRALEDLYARDMAFALRLLESVRWEMPSVLEEEAFSLRDGRMQDLGFAPTDDVMAILAKQDPKQMKLAHHVTKPDPDVVLVPSLVMSIDIKGYALLYEALKASSAHVITRMQYELVNTANRFHLAMSQSLGDYAALQKTAAFVLNMVNLALMHLSGGDVEQAAQFLTQYPAQKLFQTGRFIYDDQLKT